MRNPSAVTGAPPAAVTATVVQAAGRLAVAQVVAEDLPARGADEQVLAAPVERAAR